MSLAKIIVCGPAKWLVALALWFPALVDADQSDGKAGRNLPDSAVDMASRIDHHLESRLAKIGWQPADACSDAAFIRRAHLDLTGMPPKASDVVDFLENARADKRAELVRRLVRSPGYAERFSTIWASWLVAGEAANDFGVVQQDGLKSWLRQRFAENLRYDRLVADLLVASGSPQSGPTAFFVALEGKPEKIAARTARVFMGVQLDCAECHDHPFDRWKQEDFWGLAAYFAQLTPANNEVVMRAGDIYDTDRGDVVLPGTEHVIAPKPLVQTSQSGHATGTRRQQLTLWLTTRENPFLARATVNRVWAMLMGRGLVEPVDDMRDILEASHPELLNELSEYFTVTSYDLRNLVETIALTQAYSRDARHVSGTPPEDLYAVMQTKPLSEGQFANSVIEVARQLGQPNRQEIQQLIGQLGQLRGDASQAKVGIVNALVTLHGDWLDRTSSELSSRLLLALQAPHLDQPGQVRWLYLATLNRLPSQQEEQFFASLGDSTKEAGAALEASADESTDSPSSKLSTEGTGYAIAPQWQSDLLWALLNSTEFAMTP